ncbi:MAG: hypothetical protein O7B99_15555, partial [Planctomycetota bacterium]|nr:hypothetical protein [Planctomycetota bacterium]
ALARGESSIEGLPEGEDVRAAVAACDALAAGAEAHEVHVGESGTLARLVTAIVALTSAPGIPRRVVGRGTLAGRTSRPLFEALAGAGVGLRWLGRRHGWPVEIRPVADVARITIVDPVSSQEVSAPLFAFAARPGGGLVRVRGAIPSRGYVEMTCRVLGGFGARIACEPGADGEAFRVEGELRSRSVRVEPDASLAAVALAAGVLSGLPARVPAFPEDSVQGDVRIVEHLRAFGCRVEKDAEGLLTATGRPHRGAELDLSGEPDLAPVLAPVAAAVALQTGERSRLRGLETLPRKESDRLAGIVSGLRAVGVAARPDEGGIDVGPGDAPDGESAVLDPRSDHRMAFCYALLGLLRPGLLVSDPDCVSKTWPDFWEQMERLGCRILVGG